MYTVDENTSTAQIYGYSIVLATGTGCIVQIGFILAQAVVPRSEMASIMLCLLKLDEDKAQLTDIRGCIDQPCANRKICYSFDAGGHRVPQ
jgi:hypothetical protein